MFVHMLWHIQIYVSGRLDTLLCQDLSGNVRKCISGNVRKCQEMYIRKCQEMSGNVYQEMS